jgi:hypothetical protein
MEWLTLEVFDRDAAAWSWRIVHEDGLVAAAVGAGARYWEWHEHPYGVVFELLLPDDAAVEAFRSLPTVCAALERAPDPLTGVLVYRGRGGGSGSRMPRRPRPSPLSDALALERSDDDPRVLQTCGAFEPPRVPGRPLDG